MIQQQQKQINLFFCMEHDYVSYGTDDRVRIKSTNEYGDAFESAMGYISVFIDGEDGCRYFDIDDIEWQ